MIANYHTPIETHSKTNYSLHNSLSVFYGKTKRTALMMAYALYFVPPILTFFMLTMIDNKQVICGRLRSQFLMNTKRHYISDYTIDEDRF